jgi:imidazolonepropionase
VRRTRSSHAAGGGILSTVRATRAAGEDALVSVTKLHREWMRAHGTTTFEGKSGYGLDHDTELAQLGPCVPRAASRPGWARTPSRRSSTGRTHTSTSRLVEVLPEAAQLAEAADVFLERGSFDAAQARRYLEACRDAGLVLRLHGDQFTESGAIPLAVELGARSVDHLEATGADGVARSPRATSPASCSRPARSSSAARCLPGVHSRTRAPDRPRRPTSTPGAHSATVSRSSSRSPARR